mmetsp:Transcript_156/g.201  ORF Transcript_156/g.201 Transcript_156/m.201 type:complete len:253 (+) Transcript_156:627-1385(+)
MVDIDCSAFSTDSASDHLECLKLWKLCEVSKSGPGRKKTRATVVLNHFLRAVKKRGKVHPKFEYLRAFMIRIEKKVIRTVLIDREVMPLKQYPELEAALKAFVDDNKQMLIAIGLGVGNTRTDPSKQESKYSSFDTKCTREFYQHSKISEFHDLLVSALFSFYSSQQILAFFKIEAIANPTFSVELLRLLLLSQYFKGNPSTEQALAKKITKLTGHSASLELKFSEHEAQPLEEGVFDATETDWRLPTGLLE